MYMRALLSLAGLRTSTHLGSLIHNIGRVMPAPPCHWQKVMFGQPSSLTPRDGIAAGISALPHLTSCSHQGPHCGKGSLSTFGMRPGWSSRSPSM